MDKHTKSNRGIRIADETYLKLKHLAALDRRSLNTYIELLCEDAISKHESTHGEIQINIADLYKQE